MHTRARTSISNQPNNFHTDKNAKGSYPSRFLAIKGNNAEPYPAAAVDAAEVFRAKIYGVCEVGKRDDVRAQRKFEARHFWEKGNYGSGVCIQEKAQRKYIREREK